MKKQKRLPIEQLREAGKTARKMLVKKGIITEESSIDRILKTDNAPVLPGIPAYLPHQWTIQASQRIMMDIIILWKEKCKKDNSYVEDVIEFFKFVVKELRRQEKKFEKEMKNNSEMIKDMENVPVLSEIFSPIQKKESTHAIQRFFIDSFAVAFALKNAECTSDYANWFLDWSQNLYNLWIKPKNE